MISEHYAWLIWSSSFLLPWLALYGFYPRHRRAMGWASVFTAPFGLTEPLFVPEYWNPPSLFDLAQRTGFDVESIIFCFGIGGVCAVLYNILTGRVVRPVPATERVHGRHRYHRFILASPFAAFVLLYWLPWNPIYPGIIAMGVGAIAAMWCRPDLTRKSWIGGILFLGYYIVFLVGLQTTVPGYIDRVWNHGALLGVYVFGMPIEELLFAFAFGLYWSSVYEHSTWRQVGSAAIMASGNTAPIRGTNEVSGSSCSQEAPQ